MKASGVPLLMLAIISLCLPSGALVTAHEGIVVSGLDIHAPPVLAVDLANESWSQAFQTGVRSLAACIHDVDGDADADILLGTSPTGLALLLGDGGGMWTSGTAPSCPTAVRAVAVDDLDFDGRADVVAATSAGLKAWTNSGVGWNDASYGLPTAGSYTDMLLCDVDRDGDLDIVCAAVAGSPAPYGVEVWLNGRGTPWASGLGTLAVTNSATSVSCGDINGDGYPDIAASFETKGVAAYLGGAGPAWTPSSSGLPTTGSLTSVSIFDANGDGKTDILGAYGTSNGLRVWVGNGGTSWTANFGLPSTGIYDAAETGDFNRDGHEDVLALRDGTGAELWYGDGSLSWTESSVGLPVEDSGRMAVGDADADSWDDVMLMPASSGAALYRYEAWKTVNAWRFLEDIILAASTANSVSVVNLDGDADLEVVVLGTGIGIVIYDRSGASWTARTSPAAVGNYRSIDFGDFNLDGKMDIVAAANGIRAWAGDGSWGWTSMSSGLPTSGTAVESVAFADVHHDGMLDIITASRTNSGGRIYRGNGAGTWTATFGIPSAGSFYDFAVHDLNLDGDADVVFAGTDGLVAYAGDSSDGWTAWDLGLSVGSSYTALSLADLDMDGDLDVAVTYATPQPADLILSSPTDTWELNCTLFDALSAISLHDATMDGRPDAFALRSGRVLPLRGAGLSFDNMSTGIGIDLDAVAYAVGDMNGDGMDDIVALGTTDADEDVVRTYMGCQVIPFIPTPADSVWGVWANLTDVEVGWSPSSDEANAYFEGYTVFQSNEYNPDAAGYVWIADIPKGSHTLVAQWGTLTDSQFTFFSIVARGAGCGRSRADEQGYAQRVDFYAGWNLVSTPFDPSDAADGIASQNANISCIQAYRPDLGWAMWDRTLPPFMNTLSELSEGCGFWMKADAAGTTFIRGTARLEFTVQLLKGWNLVAHMTVRESTLSSLLVGLPWDLANGFSPTNEYRLTGIAGGEAVVPGEAYWVHLTSDAVWTGER